MNELAELKVVDGDFEVEFEILPSTDEAENSYPGKQTIVDGLYEVNAALSSNRRKIDELNKEIDRLTNHADGLDYMVAVGSGILAGVVDSLWVGEFKFERGKAWSNKSVNDYVMKVAKSKGYKGDDLNGAIKHLENKFGAPSDSVTAQFGGGLQHHLRDFAHHPTPVGLIFSMLTQFTGKAYGTNTQGVFQIVNVENKALIGKDIPQKFLFGTVFWFFHMVSDAAGSHAFAGAGTGLPGPLLSLLKEVSALPFFNSSRNKDGVKDFSLWISKLFNGTLLAEHDENGKIIKESAELMKFDLRAELGVAYELGRQAVPVILNECIVRGFYFIRRLVAEIKEKDIKKISELKRINWGKTLPFKNRTIIRMLTIATGTFTLVDLADAAIRGAVKSAGNPGLFAKEFILRVNFVGVGRFAIAVGTDIAMGIKRSKLRNERMGILSEQLHLMNAKVFYLQGDMWIAAETAEKTINEAAEMMQKTALLFIQALQENSRSLDNIGRDTPLIEEHNPGLIEDITDELKWG
ncbi:hypothetical protein FACS1894110_24140 [Spirochaetia bacterium]|nr:hypothetical protein FACS1894110_24140 [Spirochaetia bacterium]